MAMERIGRTERFRNPADHVDNPSWEELLREVRDQEVQGAVTVEVLEEEMNEQREALLTAFVNSAVDALEKWKAKFARLQEDVEMSAKMREYLENHRLDIPVFQVYGKVDGEAFLQKHDFDAPPLSDDELLLMFNLPKPLAQYWWKGGTEEWNQLTNDARRLVIEWGEMYRELMPIIWRMRDGSREVDYERVNPEGIHDPKEYYYIWRIRKQDDAPSSDW